MKKYRARTWFFGIFGAVAFFLLVVGAIIAPRARPVGRFDEITGVVVSSQLVSGRIRGDVMYATVELEGGNSVIASVASGRPLTEGTPVTVRRYRRQSGRVDYEVFAVRSGPGPN